MIKLVDGISVYTGASDGWELECIVRIGSRYAHVQPSDYLDSA